MIIRTPVFGGELFKIKVPYIVNTKLLNQAAEVYKWQYKSWLGHSPPVLLIEFCRWKLTITGIIIGEG